MNSEILIAFKLTIVEMFEKAAFVFLETVECDDFVLEGEGVEVDFFTESSSGKIQFWTTSDFCRELSRNLMESEDADDGFKALSEMLNICVGNFLTTAFGFDAQTHLGIPQISNKPFSKTASATICFKSDDEIGLTVHVKYGELS